MFRNSKVQLFSLHVVDRQRSIAKIYLSLSMHLYLTPPHLLSRAPFMPTLSLFYTSLSPDKFTHPPTGSFLHPVLPKITAAPGLLCFISKAPSSRKILAVQLVPLPFLLKEYWLLHHSSPRLSLLLRLLRSLVPICPLDFFVPNSLSPQQVSFSNPIYAFKIIPAPPAPKPLTDLFLVLPKTIFIL